MPLSPLIHTPERSTAVNLAPQNCPCNIAQSPVPGYLDSARDAVRRRRVDTCLAQAGAATTNRRRRSMAWLPGFGTGEAAALDEAERMLVRFDAVLEGYALWPAWAWPAITRVMSPAWRRWASGAGRRPLAPAPYFDPAEWRAKPISAHWPTPRPRHIILYDIPYPRAHGWTPPLALALVSIEHRSRQDCGGSMDRRLIAHGGSGLAGEDLQEAGARFIAWAAPA